MIKQKLKIVLDTNILLVSVSEFSKYHWLYRAVIEKRFDLYITNDILTEYEEIIGNRLSVNTANAVVRTLMELDNVYPTSIYFKFDFIEQDPDDNKFVDCAVACNCDYLVTNDKHFNILKTIDFPRINIVKFEEFEKILNKLG